MIERNNQTANAVDNSDSEQDHDPPNQQKDFERPPRPKFCKDNSNLITI